MLTRELLTHHVRYCPETGIFTRLKASQNGLVGKNAGWLYNGYVYLRVLGTAYKAHRLAYFYATGSWPDGDIDHINGDRADNRLSNLRVVDDAANSKNQQVYKNNTSGVPGVKYKKGSCRWEVYISNSPRIYVGSSKDWFEAVCMRKSAEICHGYHQNHGRAA